MATKYTYEMRCPRCSDVVSIEVIGSTPPPVMYCDKSRLKIELDIVRVFVDDYPVSGQDTVSVFHNLNEQHTN